MYLLVMVLFITHQSYAGWVISSGTKVKVSTGNNLKIEGNLKLLSTAQPTNQGLLGLTGDFNNQGEAILGNPQYRICTRNSSGVFDI